MPKPAGFPVIVSSPSGGGKTTIVNLLLRKEDSLVRVVTATSRPPRPGEKNGKDYHFWSEARFRDGIEKGRLAEWALVHGKYYGTPKASLDGAIKKGLTPILVIDVQGARAIRKSYPAAVTVFVLPPSWAVLKKRLLDRNDTKDIAVRLRTAESEIPAVREYDYVVINDNLDISVADLGAIIHAERLKRDRQLARLKGSPKHYRFA